MLKKSCAALDPLDPSIAIIGAGPAGMAAALQLYRSGLTSLLFENQEIQSLLINARRVENYLGMSSQTGIKLLKQFREHLRKNNISPIQKKVQQLDFDDKKHVFSIHADQTIYTANKVIIASGTQPKKLLALEKARQILEPYLFYEIFPLLKVRHKKIIIIGAGDAAFDYALNLAERNNKVFLINQHDKIKALPLLQKEVFTTKNIVYHSNMKLIDIHKGKSCNLMAKFIMRNKFKNMNVDYLIAAIGRSVQKDFYTQKLLLNESKLLRKKLLYLAGDVKNTYRQTAIATADGINVAMEIFHEVYNANSYR